MISYHEIRKRVIRHGGVWDNQKYRYIINNSGHLCRVALDKLDTVAMLNKDSWKVLD